MVSLLFKGTQHKKKKKKKKKKKLPIPPRCLNGDPDLTGARRAMRLLEEAQQAEDPNHYIDRLPARCFRLFLVFSFGVLFFFGLASLFCFLLVFFCFFGCFFGFGWLICCVGSPFSWLASLFFFFVGVFFVVVFFGCFFWVWLANLLCWLSFLLVGFAVFFFFWLVFFVVFFCVFGCFFFGFGWLICCVGSPFSWLASLCFFCVW